MTKTKIEWANTTWNPVTGCLHDCPYCYARGIAKRFEDFEPRMGGELIQKRSGSVWGSVWRTMHGEMVHVFENQSYKRTKGGLWQKASYPYGFEPTFHRYRLDEPQKWKKPRTIFVGSMCDLFGEWIPDEWITAVFDACAKAPQHQYLTLTKNPSRVYFENPDLYGDDISPWVKPLNGKANVMFGASITSGKDNDYYMDVWQNANLSWVSIEPLLGDIGEEFFTGTAQGNGEYVDYKRWEWVVIGAETGNRVDKVIPQKEWIDDILRACDDWGTPVFMKDSLIPIIGEKNMRREFPW